MINALNCKNEGRPPVWMMRQAGRYMPEYRKLRDKHGFKTMIKTPDLVSEITLQPIKAFGMDAAILFSDILVTAEALGSEFEFIEKKGPVFLNPVHTESDFSALSTDTSAENLDYVYRGIKAVKHALTPYNIPLLGFAGAPFTVASYMIEGGTSKDLKKTKQMMLREPELFSKLISRLTEITVSYINKQQDAGINAFQIFDTWAGILDQTDFKKWIIDPIETILRHTKRADIPRIVFCKNTGSYLHHLKNLDCNALSLDWQCDIEVARNILPERMAIQGNLDPYLLYAPDELLESRVKNILKKMTGDPGYIFNLGHGIMPDMKPDKIKLVVDTIKKLA